MPILESDNETDTSKKNGKDNSPKIKKIRIEKPAVTKKKLVKKKIKGNNSENTVLNGIGSANVLQKNNTINNG